MPDSPDDKTLTAAAIQVSFASVGPYRLIQLLGEGGMGEVWRAEQTEPFHRTVALKLIKAGMDPKAVVARFNIASIPAWRSSCDPKGNVPTKQFVQNHAQ